jgi:hypothetical protein
MLFYDARKRFKAIPADAFHAAFQQQAGIYSYAQLA